MSPAGSTVPESGSRLRRAGIWGAPLAVVFAVWLWLVYSSGGFIAHQWLPPSLGLGVFGLIVSLLVAYPRRPGQLSLTALLLFGGYSLWVAVSAIWADSPTRVWLESGRTFTYLLVFALAIVYLSDQGARRVFRYLVMAGGCVLFAVCMWKLGTTENIAGLFYTNRLGYPVSAPNHAAALLLVTFWPLMWLAAGPEERAPVRGIALGLATGLLGLSFMTQSRGAVWTLAITLIFMFVISPARLRTLFYLLVPALLMAYVFPRLNRYWLEGPDAVGGALAVRTLLAAALTAALIGMILALLEKWVRVSRLMKVIFGTVVLVAAVGGLVYGSITLTHDAGGPIKWTSQTWRQFTGQAPETATESHTRFALLSSSGRVGIWKVAVQELEGSPVLGVGADNFVFQYDRLRSAETYKPRQAHSFELQVLGETGIVGGVFAFGGILLILGGMLWPRCIAGWRGMKQTWLRRRQRAGGVQATETHPRTDSRWGSSSLAYGWDMALLAGAAYWLIHTSVDWLWQMAGVSIPAVLLAAAGVAGVDARVGVLWPRMNQRLRLRVPTAPTDPQPDEVALRQESAALNESGELEVLMMIPPRAAQYENKHRRRRHREHRRSRAKEMFHPPGPLSQAFRIVMVALSLLVIISTVLPYASLLYQDSALALAGSDPARAVKRAKSALSLMPTDPAPYSTQATIYHRAAVEALVTEAPDREGAVLDDLALAIKSCEKAIALEPADWTLRFHAGVAVVDLLLATGYVEGRAFRFQYDDLSVSLTGLGDWSSLAGGGAIPETGQAAASLAKDELTRDDAEYYRGMNREQLAGLAQEFLQAAKERNPLALQIDVTLAVLAEITAAE